MPGLAGIYDPRAAALEIETILQRMHRVLDVSSVAYTVQGVTGKGVGCLNLVRGACRGRLPPARDEQCGVWLVLDGELYNADELRGRLGPQVTAGEAADPAALCLALYLREGEAFVRRLNGQFNVVVYHETECVLKIATDRYGYRPLFVAPAGARVFFATEMKAIIAVLDATPSADPIGVLLLAGTGRLFGDHTWLDPIRVVDPGTIVEITERGMTSRRYFHLRFRAPPRTLSLDDYAAGFAAALRRAAARVTAGPRRVGIALSGGLDSRSALLALDPQRTPVVAYTFGDAASRDVRYAQQLAACTGVPHLHLSYEPGYLGRVLSPVVWRTEGLVPFAATQFTSLHFHRRLAARMDVLLYGHCGDALTGAHLRPEVLLARSRDRLIERLLLHDRQVAEDTLRRIFNPSFYRRHTPDVLEAVRATFTGIEQETPADVADAWDTEQRQRRGVFHSPTLDRYRFDARTPFLDNDVVDHLLQAPPRWRFQQLAYKRMIVTAFPQAATVPWAYTGRPIQGRSGADLAQVGWNYVGNRLKRDWARFTSNHQALSPRAFRNLAADLREAAGVAQAVRDFTRSPWFPGGIFDRGGIEDVVRRHWELGEDHTHMVIVLATFATAWRLFLADRPVAMPADAEPGGSPP
jgi:asparagine synthetase B (glutamine-hydrolysing)